MDADMKETFRPRAFRTDNKAVVADADLVISEYQRSGYVVTVRQLYYQMVARDLFPDSWVDDDYNERHGLPIGTTPRRILQR